MSRVVSILTYTLPAKEKDTIPAKPPINCGCDDFLLLFKDRSILNSALKGILRARIVSLTINDKPAPYLNPGTGEASYVWRYDYTIEYNDTDLSDAAYRIRKCDLEYNCCYGCAQEFATRLDEDSVKSVTGCGVTNVDPQNPVIDPRGCFSVQDSETINFTYDSTTGVIGGAVIVSPDADNYLEPRVNGLYVPTPVDVVPLPEVEFSTTNDCAAGGLGVEYCVREVTNIGVNQFLINSAPGWGAVSAAQSVGVPTPAGPLVAIGDNVVATTLLQIDNTSTCRDMLVLITNIARYNGFIGANNRVQLDLLNEIDDGGGFAGYTERKTVNENGLQQVADGHSYFHRTVLVPAGTSILIQGRATLTKQNGIGQYTFDGGQAVISDLAYIGVYV
jgi:hypothetical protein